MRAAGIDLGRVRVGVAVADELGLMAHPRPYLDGKNPKRLLSRLRELAESEQIGVFVLGLPRHLDGREGTAARRARRFAEELSRATGLPVELQDERLTTVEAAGRLREQGLDSRAARARIDSAAAALLLQSWLDARRREP
jgi:putative Holliday junction resolvase